MKSAEPDPIPGGPAGGIPALAVSYGIICLGELEGARVMAGIGRNGSSIKYQARKIGLLAFACVAFPHAQTTCPAPVASDFHVVDLTMTGLSTPTDMVLAPDGRIFISDIYTGELLIFRDGGTPRL